MMKGYFKNGIATRTFYSECDTVPAMNRKARRAVK